jgi:hypothetical protein
MRSQARWIKTISIRELQIRMLIAKARAAIAEVDEAGAPRAKEDSVLEMVHRLRRASHHATA